MSFRDRARLGRNVGLLYFNVLVVISLPVFSMSPSAIFLFVFLGGRFRVMYLYRCV